MLYRELIAVCSQIHTKHTNTLCGEKADLLNVKLVVYIVTTGLYRVAYKELYTSCSNRAVNTLLLCYRNQSVNVV